MFNNKKGQGGLLEHVKEIILALIVLGVLVTLILMVLLPSGIIASDWACKTSVAWASGTFAIFNKLGFDSLICYTDDVKSDAKKKEEALGEIAERMRKCWNMWGEGNLNPEGQNIWYGREIKCYTCYKLSFPEVEDDVSMNDINNYLQEGRKYDKLKGTDSYWNYFKKDNQENFVSIALSSKGDENTNVIERDRSYAVVYFESVKENQFGQILSWSVTGAASFATLCALPIISTPTIPICAAVGGIGGATVKSADLLIKWGWDKIRGRIPSDGIQFMDYDVAKNECVTVVRAGEEIKIDEAIKNE